MEENVEENEKVMLNGQDSHLKGRLLGIQVELEIPHWVKMSKMNK